MIETESLNKMVFLTGQEDVPGVFPFALRLNAPEEIHCFLSEFDGSEFAEEEELVYGSDFTVEELTDYSNGACVTLTATPPAGSRLAILRIVPLIQLLDLPNLGKLPSAELERALDRIVMMIQQLKEECSRKVGPGPADAVTVEDYVQTLATQKLAAGSSATAAANSADAAADSATAAANSATQAANSATQAANSAARAAAAESLVTEFELRQGLVMREIVDGVSTAPEFEDLPVGFRYYYLAPLASLTVAAAARSAKECEFEFEADTDFELTLPANLKTIGDFSGFTAGHSYLLNIRFGIAEVKEFTAGDGSDIPDDNTGTGGGGTGGGGTGGGTGGGGTGGGGSGSGGSGSGGSGSGGSGSGGAGDNNLDYDPYGEDCVLQIYANNLTAADTVELAVGDELLLDVGIGRPTASTPEPQSFVWSTSGSGGTLTGTVSGTATDRAQNFVAVAPGRMLIQVEAPTASNPNLASANIAYEPASIEIVVTA